MKQSYDTQKGEKQMRMNENHQACMPAEKKTLYRIGIFAAMNDVTIRTLRFYEERGAAGTSIYPSRQRIPVLHTRSECTVAGNHIFESGRVYAG